MQHVVVPPCPPQANSTPPTMVRVIWELQKNSLPPPAQSGAISSWFPCHTSNKQPRKYVGTRFFVCKLGPLLQLGEKRNNSKRHHFIPFSIPSGYQLFSVVYLSRGFLPQEGGEKGTTGGPSLYPRCTCSLIAHRLGAKSWFAV